jgi:hypothetical protein
MKLTLLFVLLMSSAFAGTCKIKAQLWVPAPVIILNKHKVQLDNVSIEQCIDRAQEELYYTEKMSVPLCGGSTYGNCGTLNVTASIKKVKFKFIGNAHIFNGIVKKNKAKK